ncbi:M6 family metalloprotease domain-containing protein [Bacillus sp. A31]|uniref:M6 family metalloprotease domain-containing protein n=1 Tax=Bacillus sp. A31 TaxID=3102787 RepID=UPI0039B3A228
MKNFRTVPPAPEVITYLTNEYNKKWKGLGFTYRQFLASRGYSNPAHNIIGMDDHTLGSIHKHDFQKISTPRVPITGDLNVIVLLVDFPDLEGKLPKGHYEDLLFSKGSYPTGSMSDYYNEVSKEKVSVKGEVHGWFRMPEKYSYYTNGKSGLYENYPRDARKLAEDAVKTALEHGTSFDSKLDNFKEGTITALFIVHAGQGAEKLNPNISGNHIWSHKWQMKNPQLVAPGLTAVTYLMVPQDALLGVCAHELGHLAFQWDDFYDPNYDSDGDYWDGNGIWDLMASGSYAGRELCPVHPAGLHKLQHGWVKVKEINKSEEGLTLEPITRSDGEIVKIKGPGYTKDQYLLLENRIKEKFDSYIPGEGLLVWRIDEAFGNEKSASPGMLLIQADGNNNLSNPRDGNSGDAGDPFPGLSNISSISDTGNISTSFSEIPSGVSLKNILFNQETKQIKLDVIIK